MTIAANRPKKLTYTLVEFQYGDEQAPQYYRITDRTSSVDLFGHPWTSVPEIKLTLPADVGTLGDAQAELETALLAGFLTSISSEEPFSRCRVTVLEAIDSEVVGEEPQVIYLYRGFVSQGIRNPGGHSESVKLVLSRDLARLAYPMGMPAMLGCQWVFTRRGCFIDIETIKETGTISAVSGKTLTITGLADHSADPTARYWQFGYVEIDGVRIQVMDWSQASPTQFKLRQEPPAAWSGATATLVPGCDRLYSTCDQRWNNKARFNGTGYAVPTYHPVFENPS